MKFSSKLAIVVAALTVGVIPTVALAGPNHHGPSHGPPVGTHNATSGPTGSSGPLTVAAPSSTVYQPPASASGFCAPVLSTSMAPFPRTGT